MKNNEQEMVNHPGHYNQGGIECFDVIEKFFGRDALEHFCIGNALKYLMRCQHKGNYIEDLRKARFYIDKILEMKKYEGNWENIPFPNAFINKPNGQIKDSQI